jgi:hypothetical protein
LLKEGAAMRAQAAEKESERLEEGIALQFASQNIAEGIMTDLGFPKTILLHSLLRC